jgi:uncharacterized protein (DUF2147 family)
MKNLLMLLGVIAFVSIAAIPVNSTMEDVAENAVELTDAAADIIGTWETIDDETGKAKSHVRIFLAKNGKYYGKIEKLLNRDAGDEDPSCNVCPKDDARHGQKIIGMNIVTSMEKKGDTYSEGTIIDPKTGKIYTCKMWTEGANKLMVRGYVTVLYRTQTWNRVN